MGTSGGSTDPEGDGSYIRLIAVVGRFLLTRPLSTLSYRSPRWIGCRKRVVQSDERLTANLSPEREFRRTNSALESWPLIMPFVGLTSDFVSSRWGNCTTALVPDLRP